MRMLDLEKRDQGCRNDDGVRSTGANETRSVARSNSGERGDEGDRKDRGRRSGHRWDGVNRKSDSGVSLGFSIVVSNSIWLLKFPCDLGTIDDSNRRGN